MPDPSAHVDSRRMMAAAFLTVVASVAAVLAVRQLAIRTIHPSPDFQPLAVAAPIIDTILGCCGAIAVFGLVVYYADSVRKYRRIAAAVLIVTFIPDVLLATYHSMEAGRKRSS